MINSFFIRIKNLLFSAKPVHRKSQVYWPHRQTNEMQQARDLKKQKKNDLPYVVLVFALIFLATLLGLESHMQDTLVIKKGENSPAMIIEEEKSDSIPKNSTSYLNSAESSKSEIVTFPVYVCGAVRHPGVYEVQENFLVKDAVELAGGFSESPHSEGINLAAKLVPHAQVFIPFTQEVDEVDLSQGVTNFSGKTNEGKVSLNYGTKDELITLPGIGPATADAIIKYRDGQGNQITIQDLLNVPGIKEKKLDQFRDYLVEP